MTKNQNKKMDLALDDLLSRQNYLVTQANELARSFGNLTTFEHKVLDYCFSFVQAEDIQDKMYHVNAIDLVRQFNLGSSGASYKRIAQAFRSLNENTAIYMRIQKSDGRRGILMTSLFDHLALLEDGEIEFRFSRDVEPYVFQLKEHYYSFKLSELARVRSKYTLSLMKLWNANSLGKLNSATIQGSLDDWESWFLGSDESGNPIKTSASRFKQRMLGVAIKELERLYPHTFFELTTLKRGRKVVGYRLEIKPINTSLTI